MNKLKSLSLLFIAIITLSSCTDIIELELENSDPRVVIEANLDASNQICSVFLSESL